MPVIDRHACESCGGPGDAERDRVEEGIFSLATVVVMRPL